LSERINCIHWVVICLTTGILLILQGVLQLDWIVLVLVSLPLMLLAPARKKVAKWPAWKKVFAFLGTLVLLSVIYWLGWLTEGSIEMTGRVVVVAVGFGLVLTGLVLLLRAPQ